MLKTFLFKWQPAVLYEDEGWEGIKRAEGFGPPCPQFEMSSQTVKGEEDCLFLNVFVPAPPKKNIESWDKLPVVVFIHGGAFSV